MLFILKSPFINPASGGQARVVFRKVDVSRTKDHLIADCLIDSTSLTVDPYLISNFPSPKNDPIYLGRR